MDQTCRGGEGSCYASPAIGFEMCPLHLDTIEGRTHVFEVIRSQSLFTVADLENEIAKRTDIPDDDYHTSALQKMDATLSEVIRWTADARRRLEKIPEDDWRYTTSRMGEQLRKEVEIYERGLDREARVLKDVSKMALAEKLVSLGKAQTELIIRIMMNVIARMELSPEAFDKARAILLDEFRNNANLPDKLGNRVEGQLTSPLVLEEGHA